MPLSNYTVELMPFTANMFQLYYVMQSRRDKTFITVQFTNLIFLKYRCEFGLFHWFVWQMHGLDVMSVTSMLVWGLYESPQRKEPWTIFQIGLTIWMFPNWYNYKCLQLFILNVERSWRDTSAMVMILNIDCSSPIWEKPTIFH